MISDKNSVRAKYQQNSVHGCHGNDVGHVITVSQ